GCSPSWGKVRASTRLDADALGSAGFSAVGLGSLCSWGFASLSQPRTRTEHKDPRVVRRARLRNFWGRSIGTGLAAHGQGLKKVGSAVAGPPIGAEVLSEPSQGTHTLFDLHQPLVAGSIVGVASLDGPQQGRAKAFNERRWPRKQMRGRTQRKLEGGAEARGSVLEQSGQRSHVA